MSTSSNPSSDNESDEIVTTEKPLKGKYSSGLSVSSKANTKPEISEKIISNAPPLGKVNNSIQSIIPPKTLKANPGINQAYIPQPPTILPKSFEINPSNIKPPHLSAASPLLEQSKNESKTIDNPSTSNTSDNKKEFNTTEQQIPVLKPEPKLPFNSNLYSPPLIAPIAKSQNEPPKIIKIQEIKPASGLPSGFPPSQSIIQEKPPVYSLPQNLQKAKEFKPSSTINLAPPLNQKGQEAKSTLPANSTSPLPQNLPPSFSSKIQESKISLVNNPVSQIPQGLPQGKINIPENRPPSLINSVFPKPQNDQKNIQEIKPLQKLEEQINESNEKLNPQFSTRPTPLIKYPEISKPEENKKINLPPPSLSSFNQNPPQIIPPPPLSGMNPVNPQIVGKNAEKKMITRSSSNQPGENLLKSYVNLINDIKVQTFSKHVDNKSSMGVSTVLPAKVQGPIKKLNLTEQIKNLVELTTEIISNININNYLEIKQEIHKIIQDLQEINPKIAKNLKENISFIIKCSLCQSNDITIELKCKHILCEKCSTKNLIVKESIKENISEYQYHCPLCDIELTPYEINSIFSNESAQAIKQKNALEIIFIQKNKENDYNIYCKMCKTRKNYNMFYDFACMHMCIDCIGHEIRNGKENCKYCNEKFERIDSISSTTRICHGCNYEWYFLGNFMKILSDGHVLCCHCLSVTATQGQCKACDKKITKLEQIDINYFLFVVCESCKRDLFKQEFTNLDRPICNDCSHNH